MSKELTARAQAAVTVTTMKCGDLYVKAPYVWDGLGRGRCASDQYVDSLVRRDHAYARVVKRSMTEEHVQDGRITGAATSRYQIVRSKGGIVWRN